MANATYFGGAVGSPFRAIARLVSSAFFLCLLIAGASWSAAGQGVTHGAMAGTVTDSSGAVIVNASVVAQEATTGVKYETKTNSAGEYRIADLTFGTYTVTVTATGFKASVSNGVVVDVGTTRGLDVSLQPGSVSQSVVVNESATSIETETSEVGQVITTQEQLDLPLALGGVGATRSVEAFVFLAPGTTGPGTNNGAGGVFESKVSGGQNFGTEILLDGASMDRSENGSSFDEAAPSVEAIGQFKVVTSTPPADFGRSTGGFETFATKAGTNDYHGHVYEIFQNEDLNANSFFSNLEGAQRAPDKKNDYGLTFGGPVWLPHIYNGHGRTFFFFSWEQYKQNNGANITSTLPTDAERGGDFSAIEDLNPADVLGTNPCDDQPIHPGEIFDPSTTTTVDGVECRLPFPGNKIDTPLSGVATAALAYYPHAQNQNNLTNNFTFTSTGQVADTLTTIRIDHSLGSRNKFFFTYNSRENDHAPLNIQFDGPGYPGGQVQDFVTHYIRFGWDFTFTPALLNQLTLGYNRTESLNTGASASYGKEWDTTLGITGLPTNSVFPALNFNAGFDNMGYNVDNLTYDNGYRINDTLTWVKGKQTLRFGTDLRLQVYNPITFSNESGTFDFLPGETAGVNGVPSGGNGFASFLLGDVNDANAGIYAQQPKFIQPYYGFFVEDDWKVLPTLTLNLGLRWDTDAPRREAHGNYTDFSPTATNPGAGGLPGALVFAGTGAGRNGDVNETWGDTYHKDFGPRIGFAWAPGFLHGNSVLRGGYAIYYGPIVYADFGGGGLRQGFVGGLNPTTAVSPDGFNPAFAIDSGVPAYPAVPDLDPTQLNNGGSPWYISPSNGAPAVVQNWSLEVQHQLKQNWLLDVAYVGEHGTRLRSQFDGTNTLNPSYFSLGNLLNENISSPDAVNAGIPVPYPGFNRSVGDALTPFPQYGLVNGDCCLENLGQSSFDALEAYAQHRFANGLTLLASYTWSKTFTDAADSLLPDFANFAGGGGPQNPYDHRGDKSISTQNIPNQFVLSYIYQLPVGEGKKFLNKGGVVNEFLGGWEIGGVQRYQSGEPLSFGCTPYGVQGFNGCLRLDRVAGQPLTSEEVRNGTFSAPLSLVLSPNWTIGDATGPCTENMDGTFSSNPFGPQSTYWNCAAFFDPNIVAAGTPGVPFQFGNMPRVTGEVHSQAFFNEDFSIIKRTRVTEKSDIFFQADLLNAFNRHVFARPVTDFPTAPDFGQINTTAYPSAFGNANSFGRIVQFTMKVEF